MKLDSTLEHGSTPELSSTLKHVSTATPLQPALFPLHEMKRPSSSGGVSANHNVRQDVPRNDHVGVEEIGSVSANPNLRQEALQNDPLGTDEDGGASMLLASIAEEGEIFVLAPERLRRSTSSTPSPELARQGSRNLQDSFDTEDYTEMWPSDPQLFTSTPTARVQDITYPAIPQKRKAAESFKDKYPASTRDGSRGIPEQSAQVELPGAKDRPSSMESRIADNSEDGVLTGIQKADGIKAQNVTPLGQEQSLTLRGYRSLSPNSWLSNDAIDIGLAAFNPDPDRFHIFDTAFVKADQRSQMKVSPRVAKVLQQNQKLCALICPVNLSQSHWTLGIIEVPQRQVLIFDSLNTSPCSSEWATTIQCLAKTILDDIGDEAADTSTPWKVAKLQTNLQQRDSFSCGIYIIATATLYMHGVLDRFPELEPLVKEINESQINISAIEPRKP
ncbi:hypothetical protein KC333_g5555 [Hortaea werneckii]|nr:hypothetical protein KC333_g5555 [Hortaea werneckii]KAI7308719.1 hypothetical protein KC326_g7318 [Hortaea werneckii]